MYTQRPAPFEYHRPASLDEALALLGNGETRALAGGHSLLPLMKTRLVAPTALVDLGRIPGLADISREGDAIVIGAMATHAAVASSSEIREACPVLAETAEMVADVQVRNRGTIGGSLAHADPGADYPAVMKALEATIVATGKGGSREIAADDFFVDVFTTSLQPGELVTSVRVPATAQGTGAAYEKYRHPASRYAVVGAAAVVSVEGGTCSSARLAVGGASGAPVTVTAAGDALVGDTPSEDAIASSAQAVRAAIPSPLSDSFASGEYRVHLAVVMARRALSSAFSRAAGGA